MRERIKKLFCRHTFKMCNINKYLTDVVTGNRLYGFNPGMRCNKCGKIKV